MKSGKIFKKETPLSFMVNVKGKEMQIQGEVKEYKVKLFGTFCSCSAS